MLVEYLTGEAGGLEEQLGASRISRLIIAGNSLATVMTQAEETERDRKSVSILRPFNRPVRH